jgi:hypothetical protein
MLVDAKVPRQTFTGRPDALGSSTGRAEVQKPVGRRLATLKGYKTNLRGGIDVNPQI